MESIELVRQEFPLNVESISCAEFASGGSSTLRPASTLRYWSNIEQFVEAGFAIHWLRPRGKNPIGDRWQTKPVATLDKLRATYSDGNNVGVRLGEYSRVAGGYLHVLDIDIREPTFAKDAWSALARLLPDVDFISLPSVISGSGGESRHIYVVSDHAFKKSKLARSDGFKMVFDAKKDREVKKRDWEIDLFGTGVQVAMPPSIHPDTEQPYRWEREFDFDLLAMGIGPFVPSKLLDCIASRPDEESETFGANTQKLGLTTAGAKDILARLPLDYWCEDRDGWCAAGMALKHEFGEDGYALWTEFSMQSEKFDARNQRTVWKSFKGKTSRPIRMASLIDAAEPASMVDEFEDLLEPELGEAEFLGEDFDALIGPKAGDETPPEDNDFDSQPIPSPTSWRSLLDATTEGAFKNTQHNADLILMHDPRLKGLAQLNEFTHETVQRSLPGIKPARANAAKATRQLEGRAWQVSDALNGDLWSDDRDFAIRSIIDAPKSQGGYGYKISLDHLRAAVVNSANHNCFHPVREYFESHVWDGVERLDQLFVKYLGADDTPYAREVASLTLIAAVTRIYEPGAKFDHVPILEGLQGKRKSTFIRILARHWFGELEDFSDRKKLVEQMQGNFILELPELSAFSRAEVNEVKAFVSSCQDQVRLAYARRAHVFPRQCVFFGSTNESEYLRDPTGNRRWWPIECRVDAIDTEALELEIDQIWAEAVERYRRMRAQQPRGTLPLYLSERASGEAFETQESRRSETGEEGLGGKIAAWLARPVADDGFDDIQHVRTEVCLMEIWCECLGGAVGSYSTTQARSLGRAMKYVPGWKSEGTRKTERYGPQKVYRRTDVLGLGLPS